MLCLFSLKSCLDLSLLLIKIVRFGVGVCLVWVVVYLGVGCVVLFGFVGFGFFGLGGGFFVAGLDLF